MCLFPSTADEEYLPLKDIVNDLKIFTVKNNILSFLYSSINILSISNIALRIKKNPKNYC